VVKHEVVGVVGEGVGIPCNCTPSYSRPDDKPVLILWYKDKAKLPIYSFDLRSSTGQHWRDTNSLGERGYVFYEETPHACRSSLNLEPVEGRDGGRYRCRVDYRVSPTRNTRIKLKLVARPGLPSISRGWSWPATPRHTRPARTSDSTARCRAGTPPPASPGGWPARPSSPWRTRWTARPAPSAVPSSYQVSGLNIRDPS